MNPSDRLKQGITKRGCCGRYNTIVTNLPVEPDQPLEEELCLYKKNGSCGICMKHCSVQELSPEGYDRQKCFTVLRKNGAKYTMFGSSYVDESENPNSEGSGVCAKCVTQSPCVFW